MLYRYQTENVLDDRTSHRKVVPAMEEAEINTEDPPEWRFEATLPHAKPDMGLHFMLKYSRHLC